MARQTAKLTFGPAARMRRTARLWLDAASVARRSARLQVGPVPAARQGAALSFGLMIPARQVATLQFGPLIPARQTATLQFGVTTPARRMATLQFGVTTPARQTATLQFGVTTPARQIATLQFGPLIPARRMAMLSFGPVPAARRCSRLWFGPVHDAGPQTRVEIAGTPVSPIAIRVIESADQAAITAVLEFAEALSPGLGPPAPVLIEMFGARYELLGESYSRSREFGARSWTLTAASPAYRLQSRYAAAVDGELAGMASSIAQGLAGGIPADWRMVDWQVLPGRLAPGGQAPLDVLRDLVSAAGGVLTSARDGRLLAMPWPPHRPEDWARCIEAETDSLSAMVSIQDAPDVRELYNAVAVSDETVGGLRIEVIEETRVGNRVEVRVYQVPWRDDFDTRHTAATWALLRDLGIEERTIEAEMLEIVSGQGKTQYPIYGISASRWNKIDLGAITHNEDGTITTEIQAESLLFLSYITRARRLLVEMREPEPEPIMIIAEEI